MANNQSTQPSYNNNNGIKPKLKATGSQVNEDDLNSILSSVLSNAAAREVPEPDFDEVEEEEDDDRLEGYPEDKPNSIFAVWYWALHEEFNSWSDYKNLILVYCAFIGLTALIVAIVFSAVAYFS